MRWGCPTRRSRRMLGLCAGQDQRHCEQGQRPESVGYERWAMDVTHIPCGRDGWGHLVAVIDCHDRGIVAYEVHIGRVG